MSLSLKKVEVIYKILKDDGTEERNSASRSKIISTEEEGSHRMIDELYDKYERPKNSMVIMFISSTERIFSVDSDILNLSFSQADGEAVQIPV